MIPLPFVVPVQIPPFSITPTGGSEIVRVLSVFGESSGDVAVGMTVGVGVGVAVTVTVRMGVRVGMGVAPCGIV